jgi:hypothetical protein
MVQMAAFISTVYLAPHLGEYAPRTELAHAYGPRVYLLAQEIARFPSHYALRVRAS